MSANFSGVEFLRTTSIARRRPLPSKNEKKIGKRGRERERESLSPICFRGWGVCTQATHQRSGKEQKHLPFTSSTKREVSLSCSDGKKCTNKCDAQSFCFTFPLPLSSLSRSSFVKAPLNQSKNNTCSLINTIVFYEKEILLRIRTYRYMYICINHIIQGFLTGYSHRNKWIDNLINVSIFLPKLINSKTFIKGTSIDSRHQCRVFLFTHVSSKFFPLTYKTGACYKSRANSSYDSVTKSVFYLHRFVKSPGQLIPGRVLTWA